MNIVIPTPYPKLNDVLGILVSSIQEILKDNFVGAYLQGSFAIGDFDIHSDVDFIVLSYCRMLHDLIRGYPGSKRAGAEWAKANLDPSWSPLIDRTWDGRPDPATKVRQPADPEDFQQTLEFIKHITHLSYQYR